MIGERGDEEGRVREHYREELDDIDAGLVALADAVGSAMSRATTALLDADVAAADLVIAGDEQIDAARESIEQRCFTLLARQQPVATDLRTITTAMRIPDHAVPQEVRPILLEAGHVAESLVATAAAVMATLDIGAAARLEAQDDLMDRLHGQLFRGCSPRTGRTASKPPSTSPCSAATTIRRPRRQHRPPGRLPRDGRTTTAPDRLTRRPGASPACGAPCRGAQR